MKSQKLKFIIIPTLIASIILPNNISFANEVAETKPVEISKDKNGAVKIPLTVEEYKEKSGAELATLIREKKITSEELVNLAYKVIKEENPKLNAVLTTREQEALKEAQAFDSSYAVTNFDNKPFAGVPILLKGLGHVYKGSDKSNGSLLYKDTISNTESSVTKELKNLGFIVLGQTNYPEFGFRNITDSKLFGTSNNPWDISRNSGGSSGGSASAIASGMTPIASGSDAGGSIRIPSSWSGLIGLKPSRAMTDKGKKDSSNTVVHFPLTKTIEDAEILLNNLSTKKDELIKVDDIKKLKIGYTTKSPMGTPVSEDAKKAVEESVKFLKAQGFEVEEVDLPIDGRQLMRDYTYGNLGYPLGLVSDKQLAKLFEKQGITKYDLDPLTWALGRTKAKDVNVTMNFAEDLKGYTAQMEKLHENYPIMLTPTNAVPAPLNTDKYVEDDIKEKLYNIENLPKEERFELLNRQWEPMLRKTPFTQIANLTGEPALSLPTYLNKDGLPLGIMLNGRWGMDNVLLQFGKLFEENNMFKMRNNIHNTASEKTGNKVGINYYNSKFEYNTGESVSYELPSITEEELKDLVSLNGNKIGIDKNGNLFEYSNGEELSHKLPSVTNEQLKDITSINGSKFEIDSKGNIFEYSNGEDLSYELPSVTNEQLKDVTSINGNKVGVDNNGNVFEYSNGEELLYELPSVTNEQLKDVTSINGNKVGVDNNGNIFEYSNDKSSTNKILKIKNQIEKHWLKLV